ncbi:MAG: glutathione S-transferase family protein [Betaproteobacteria bacterium]|nr:glutathione S-transferase family protein [Betaproteobacteria bacterium]
MKAPADTEVELFGLARSVYTRIARLVLEEKRVPYALTEVEIFGPAGVPKEHLARHPFGRIPVLRHGERSLYETAAITRYVDEAFDGPALQPADAGQRAQMNQVIGLLDAYAYRPLVWGVWVQRVRVPLNGGVPDEALIAASMSTARTCLGALATLMSAAPYFAGHGVSLADLHAYPMLRYFALAPEGGAMLSRHPNLQRWYEGMRERRSVARTLSPLE